MIISRIFNVETVRMVFRAFLIHLFLAYLIIQPTTILNIQVVELLATDVWYTFYNQENTLVILIKLKGLCNMLTQIVDYNLSIRF